jgi:hypothetical protein
MFINISFRNRFSLQIHSSIKIKMYEVIDEIFIKHFYVWEKFLLFNNK